MEDFCTIVTVRYIVIVKRKANSGQANEKGIRRDSPGLVSRSKAPSPLFK